MPPGVGEDEAVALQALHDEALAAEEADADRFWKAMPMDTPWAAHRNESFWQISSPPELGEVEGEDAAGVGRGEGHALHARAAVGEDGHEQALAGEQPLARARAARP